MSRQDTLNLLRQNSPMITVGVLTADLMHLADDLEKVETAGVRMLHFDVMDGNFCPALTFGPAFVKGVKTDLLKDVHLMIENPIDKIENFVIAGADLISLNIESSGHIHKALQYIGECENVNDPDRGILRGVVLNPGTPVEMVRPLLSDLDFIVLLAVNPGWSGQSYIRATDGKLAELKKIIEESDRDILIGIDGGIKKNNIADVVAMGVNLIVTGSAVFDGKDAAGNARSMMEAIQVKREMENNNGNS